MNIFIDTKTGTWGDPEGLVLVDISEAQQEALDNMSDTEAINFGLEHGTPVEAATHALACIWAWTDGGAGATCAFTTTEMQNLIDHAWEKHGVREEYAERDLEEQGE